MKTFPDVENSTVCPNPKVCLRSLLILIAFSVALGCANKKIVEPLPKDNGQCIYVEGISESYPANNLNKANKEVEASYLRNLGDKVGNANVSVQTVIGQKFNSSEGEETEHTRSVEDSIIHNMKLVGLPPRKEYDKGIRIGQDDQDRLVKIYCIAKEDFQEFKKKQDALQASAQSLESTSESNTLELLEVKPETTNSLSTLSKTEFNRIKFGIYRTYPDFMPDHPPEKKVTELNIEKDPIGDWEMTRLVTVGSYREYVHSLNDPAAETRKLKNCAYFENGSVVSPQPLAGKESKATWDKPFFTDNAQKNYGGDDYPVVCVSFAEAVQYAKYLTQSQSQYEYRLPRLYEWYAIYHFRYQRRIEEIRKAKSVQEKTVSECDYSNLMDLSYKETVGNLSEKSYANCNDREPYISPVGKHAKLFGADKNLEDLIGNVKVWLCSEAVEQTIKEEAGECPDVTLDPKKRRIVAGLSWRSHFGTYAECLSQPAGSYCPGLKLIQTAISGRRSVEVGFRLMRRKKPNRN